MDWVVGSPVYGERVALSETIVSFEASLVFWRRQLPGQVAPPVYG